MLFCRTEGRIVSFDTETNAYIIEWQDGETDEYTDFDLVDEMVYNAANDVGADGIDDELDDDTSAEVDLANYQPWQLDTAVLLQFPNGWYEGFITDFQMPSPTTVVYEVTWTDGEVKTYTDIREVDQMVFNAKEYDPWEAGTPVHGHFDDEGEESMNGYISSFANGQYEIAWDNGTSQIYFDFDTVDSFVFNARGNDDGDGGNDGESDVGPEDGGDIWDGYEPWGNETPVSYEFDNGWREGKISGYADGVYEVTWSDGSINRYGNFDMIDQMVANARISLPDTGADDSSETEESVDDTVQDGSDNDEGSGIEESVDDTIQDGSDNDDGSGTEESLDDNVEDGSGEDGNSGAEEKVEDEMQDGSGNDDNSGTGESVDDDTTGDSSGNEGEQVEVEVNQDEIYGRVYENGTMVCKKFDDGWWVGFVESYEGGTYTVRWADDATNEYVEGEEMDQMVTDAQEGPIAADSDPYPVGTIVYKKNSDVWYQGTIISYEKYMYTVSWEDGDETYYVDGIELDHMVAYGIKVAEESQGGLTTGGKVGIVVAALGVSLLIGLVLTRPLRKKKLSSRESRRMRYTVHEAERKKYGLPPIS